MIIYLFKIMYLLNDALIYLIICYQIIYLFIF